MTPEQLDLLLDQFEAEWIAGRRPLIADYLAELSQNDHADWLASAIPLDVEYRVKGGDLVTIGDYQVFGTVALAIADQAIQAESASARSAKESKTAIVDQPNKMIGPYKLVEKIGEGGMGSVWMAEQSEPIRRSVALKLSREIPTPRYLSETELKHFQERLTDLAARFEAERQTQAVMDHPNIAKVLDAGTTDKADGSRPYFVMELIEGVVLTRYCDLAKATVRQRIELLIQACKAIQHAHQKGVIHRDIKPSNILVTQQDGRPIVKVIDFGLAKVTKEADNLRGVINPTKTGIAMGTFVYMSPEQASGDAKKIDTRSDVYSLGALLFELLTGSTPITSQRAAELLDVHLLAAIRDELAPRPSSRLAELGDAGKAILQSRQTDIKRLGSTLRGELDWIALKALAKEQNRRYESPSQLADDLQRYLDGEAVVARPPSVTYRLRKTIRKHRIAASFVVLALSLSAIGFAATYSQLQRALIAEKQSEEIARQEKDQRLKVEENLKRAELAETATKERVQELEELTDFQSKQFSDLDVAQMAENLKQTLRDVYSRTAREGAELNRSSFGEYLDDINHADVARIFLKNNIFDPAVLAVDERYSQQPIFRASIYNSIGASAHALGIAEMPLRLFGTSLELRKEHLGSNHSLTLATAKSLASVIHENGSLPEAEALFRDTLEKQQKLFGSLHYDSLETASCLAILLDDRGNGHEAESLYREVLKGRRESLGNDHPDTLKSIDNLAGYLNGEGKSVEAESLLREALAIRRSRFGDRHLDTLSSIGSLASHLSQEGNLADAEPLARQAMDGLRELLVVEHPSSLRSSLRLASILDKQKQFNEAELLYRSSLTGFRRVLGSKHPDTLMAINGLAMFLRTQGLPESAEPLYLEALEVRRSLFGNLHQDTLTSTNNLALFFHRQGKPEKAEPLYRETLAGFRELLGNEHPASLLVTSNLALFLSEQGNLEEAERYYRDAFEGNRKLRGMDHQETLECSTDLAQILEKQSNFNDAEPLYRETLGGYRRLFGNNHEQTIKSIDKLARFLDYRRNDNGAETLYREALEWRRKNLGTDHQETIQTINNLAMHLDIQGKTVDAEAFYREALEKTRSLLGDNHAKAFSLMNDLALFLGKNGKPDEAEALYREALDGRRNQLGGEHPDTLTSINNLAVFFVAQGRQTEAEPLFREFVANGKVSWQVCRNRIRLGTLLLQTGKDLEEAKQLIELGAAELTAKPDSIPLSVRKKVLDEAISAITQLENNASAAIK